MSSNAANRTRSFPTCLPPTDQVEVPFPANSHPGWTVDPYAGVGIPSTFDKFITLPDPFEEPAHYAAVADCIRMTNWVFATTGQYSKKHPLTEAHINALQHHWPSKVTAAGRRVKLAPEQHYPLPPDGRMLLIKEQLGDCTNARLPVLWVAVCDEVARMTVAEWEACLGASRDDLIALADTRLGSDESWLVREVYKRCLVWSELVDGESERAELFEEKQPSPEELKAFFEKEKVKENGATLVDVCHAFPRARDAQMLVYQTEQFAELKEQPSVPTHFGIEDPVESRYFPKAESTKQAGVQTTYTGVDVGVQTKFTYVDAAVQTSPTAPTAEASSRPAGSLSVPATAAASAPTPTPAPAPAPAPASTPINPTATLPEPPKSPRKRAATEDPEPSRETKKARKAPKIQCAGRTLKGMRCKRRKDREGEEEQWLCKTHSEEEGNGAYE